MPPDDRDRIAPIGSPRRHRTTDRRQRQGRKAQTWDEQSPVQRAVQVVFLVCFTCLLVVATTAACIHLARWALT